MATRRWRGAGDEDAAGVAAPAIALRAWILLAPAMFSGTVLAEFALARTAGRTQLEATVCVAPSVARVAAEYCDRVLRIPKAGKRAAIAAGLRASDPETDVVVVLDSDTIWAPRCAHRAAAAVCGSERRRSDAAPGRV